MGTRTTRPSKVALASLAGTSIEYYDFFIYGTAAALVFNRLFFPSFDPLVGTLLSFSTFAVAFIARPIGGIVLGHFGDRVGRKAMLIITLTTMGASTLLVGLLPSYDSIGIAAPILLVALRFIQGFSLGGEYTGAVLMTSEHSQADQRGYFGSWVQTGAQFGLIIANLVFLAVSGLSHKQMLAWGWRVPFIASVALVALGFFIRLRITESPTFQKVKEEGRIEKAPLLTVLRESPGTILLTAGASISSGVTFYGISVFGLSYGVSTLGLSNAQMLTVLIVSAALCIVLTLYFGRLSDRLGYRPVFVGGLIGTAVVAVPWGLLVGTGSFGGVFAGYLLIVIPYAAQWATLGVFFSRAFEGQVRYSGMSLGYTLGLILGGGLTPIIFANLVQMTRSILGVAGYLGAAGIVSAVCGGLIVQDRRRAEPTAEQAEVTAA
jgi:MFS family permease